MKKNLFNKLINNNILYLSLLILIAFFANFYYANLGVFPIDTFLHYDAAYKILNGEYPVKDYWIVSGFIVDFLQAFFFQILGVNWKSYVVHSSIINLSTSILTYYIFLNLNLKKITSTVYAICFSLLAYPTSGTPFVDLHATFFCLIAIYLTLFYVIKPNRSLLWVAIIFFYFLAFFSKQTPTAYLITLNVLIFGHYFFLKNKRKVILIIIISTLFFLFLFILILKFLNIEIINLYIQYLAYPIEIGTSRVDNFNFSFEKFFNRYKFILLPFIILTIVKLKKLAENKNPFFSKEMMIYLIFFSTLISFLIHQLITKNQIYIYFLIPIFCAYLHSEINQRNYKKKKIIIILILISTILITFKYHIRYNEGKKFHDFIYIDLSKSIEAEVIDKSLSSLKWSTFFFRGESIQEINLIKEIILELNLKSKNIILATHYSFLDSVTKKKLNNLNRTYTLDGASMPLVNNKYYNVYKNFILKKILDQDIEEIYLIKEEGLDEGLVHNYINKECLLKKEDKIFIIYEINKNCAKKIINSNL